jgi:hypothetical protein
MLLGFAFLTGLGLGPILDMAIMINPTILPSALLLTTGVFASFTGKFIYQHNLLIINTHTDTYSFYTDDTGNCTVLSKKVQYIGLAYRYLVIRNNLFRQCIMCFQY